MLHFEDFPYNPLCCEWYSKPEYCLGASFISYIVEGSGPVELHSVIFYFHPYACILPCSSSLYFLHYAYSCCLDAPQFSDEWLVFGRQVSHVQWIEQLLVDILYPVAKEGRFAIPYPFKMVSSDASISECGISEFGKIRRSSYKAMYIGLSEATVIYT